LPVRRKSGWLWGSISKSIKQYTKTKITKTNPLFASKPMIYSLNKAFFRSYGLTLLARKLEHYVRTKKISTKTSKVLLHMLVRRTYYNALADAIKHPEIARKVLASKPPVFNQHAIPTSAGALVFVTDPKTRYFIELRVDRNGTFIKLEAPPKQ